MDITQDASKFAKILRWKARDCRHNKWVIVRPSSRESNMEGEEVGYGIFTALAFQIGQTITIYIDVY